MPGLLCGGMRGSPCSAPCSARAGLLLPVTCGLCTVWNSVCSRMRWMVRATETLAPELHHTQCSC